MHETLRPSPTAGIAGDLKNADLPPELDGSCPVTHACFGLLKPCLCSVFPTPPHRLRNTDTMQLTEEIWVKYVKYGLNIGYIMYRK